MGLLGLDMGKVIRLRKKLVGSAVFLKLVRPLVFSEPACAENRVGGSLFFQQIELKTKTNPSDAYTVFRASRVTKDEGAHQF